MRFVLWNIRYGAGAGWRFHVPVPFISGYLRPTGNTLEKIIAFLRQQQADIIGLVEVDNGSYRSGKLNQAEEIARRLGHSHVFESKYGAESVAQQVPVMREQGNAFITNQQIQARGFHYFRDGIKRLVIELDFQEFTIFLVHLSLKYRHRQQQLGELHALFQRVDKPMIVAGDFNALWGDHELNLFLAATHLHNANVEGLATFPSHAPRRQLDFVLYSDGVRMQRFEVPRVSLSDHLPVVFDFEVE
jgi:endonuclease/exonuclease/phosphatase family metal-dependent hydrolase